MNYKKLFVVLIIFITSFLITSQAKAGVSQVSGWGWSSNIGHISFNCSNLNTCGTASYHVDFSTSTATLGTFSGYAWSSNVGWISFNTADIASCPIKTEDAGDRTPRSNLSNGSVLGWARAIAGGSDGWDGCIHLSGTNHMTGVQDGSRGITFNTTANEFRGYAWGDTNVGWLTFKSSLGFPVKIPNFGGPATPSCTINTPTVSGTGPTYDVSVGITLSNYSTSNKYILNRQNPDGTIVEVDRGKKTDYPITDPGVLPGIYIYTVTAPSGSPSCTPPQTVNVRTNTAPPGPAGTLWLDGKNTPTLKTETSIRTNQSTTVNWNIPTDWTGCVAAPETPPTNKSWFTNKNDGGTTHTLSGLPADIYTLQINCTEGSTNSVRIIVTGSDIHEQ